MRRLIMATAAVLTVAALAGCQSSGGSKPAVTSSAVKADETAAASVVSKCMPKNVLDLTAKSGRAAFVKCVSVPPANQAKFTSCLTAAAQHSHLLTKAGRKQYAEVAVAQCYEANR